MESPSGRKVAALLLGLAVVVPLILLMFIGPASRGTPHELPIGVAGPAPAVQQVEAALEAKQPGAFEVHAYADEAQLTQAVKNRDIYGGFVLGAAPATIIASGASPAVATMLTQIGAQMPGPQPQVRDVAAPAPNDPRGAGFGSMVMPVFLAGAALGLALTMVVGRREITAVLLPVGAAVVGATTVGVAMWIGVLSGGFWGQWLAMSIGILAISAAVAGLVALMGPAGVGVAALLFMLVGMPLAGIASPPEFLPSIWGAVGQWLPLGATGTALRSAVFFDGAGSAAAYVALGLWIVVGYLLLLVVAASRDIVGYVDYPGVRD
ncbi:ABC transporter permease [Gordonia crocea]|uniref:Membrane protein n=1 Tax=Gordonia crocea TaxID=589162 RepID=A0A7M3SV32_9ACTN|nr:ABC transporter permease [Gordonia crocea]GED96506.1 membrane protein [Gordonia crocea]